MPKSPFIPILMLLSFSAQAAIADSSDWQKLDSRATDKLAAGKVKKALSLWRKALVKANDSENTARASGQVHTKMAQCYLLLEDFPLCDEELKEAAQQFEESGTKSDLLTNLQAELKKVYRSRKFSDIGSKVAADLLKKAGIETVGIEKLKNGNRIEFFLSDKFEKTIDRPPINRVMLDKRVSFELYQESDGTITLERIRGLLLRAKLWIAIKRAVLNPQAELGEPTAHVTAEKIGFQKTVTFKVPISLIDPVETLVARVKDFSDGKTDRILATHKPPSNKVNVLWRLARKAPLPLLHSSDVLKSAPVPAVQAPAVQESNSAPDSKSVQQSMPPQQSMPAQSAQQELKAAPEPTAAQNAQSAPDPKSVQESMNAK